MSQFVTGEAVALDLRPAGLPSRVLAGVVDGALQLALLLALFGLAALVGSGSGAAESAIGILIIVLVLIVYPVGFETALRGRTPGKAAMGLRVVRDDGGPIGFRQALVRGLAGAFLERFGISFFFLAFALMLANRSGKRLGDLMAGTLVLQERVPSRGGQVATMPPQLAGWAASLDLSGLPDELALQARSFVSRAADLTETAREDLGGRLVAAVLARVSPPPPPGTPGWAVLAAVLAERRRREEQRLGVQPPPVRAQFGVAYVPPVAAPEPAQQPPAPMSPTPMPPAPIAPAPPPSTSGFTLPF